MINHKKRILILHGWNSNSKEAWFPLAEKEFSDLGCDVTVPDLPGDYFPDYNGWLQTIEDFVPDENAILIGHSLGGVAILKYLSQTEIKVKQIVLVATPIEPMDFGQIESFFETDFNWEKIKKNAGKISLIYDENDPVIPLEHGKKFAEKLNTDLIVLPGGTHLFLLDMKVLRKVINE
jgi:predicted alpha/beta hydrolase family esterase